MEVITAWIIDTIFTRDTQVMFVGGATVWIFERVSNYFERRNRCVITYNKNGSVEAKHCKRCRCELVRDGGNGN